MVRTRLDVIKSEETYHKQEKEQLTKLEQNLKHSLLKMEQHMKELDGISYALYYEMMVNGLNPNKAVEKVAFKYDISPSTIWKRYYKEVKKLKE